MDWSSKCKQIKAVVFDIDGTITDGRIGYGCGSDDMIKFFSAKDGLEKWGRPILLLTSEDGLEWVKEYLPNAYKNLIISHHKELNIGDYLIDDSTFNGAAEFPGKHIQIWSKEFPNWESILNYLIPPAI